MKRKMKHCVVTARGEGLRNEKSTRAGPVLPYTHKDALTQNTHMHKSKVARSPPPRHPLPSPSLFEGDM